MDLLFERRFDLTEENGGSEYTPIKYLVAQLVSVDQGVKAIALNEIARGCAENIRLMVKSRTKGKTWTMMEWFKMYVTVLYELKRTSRRIATPAKRTPRSTGNGEVDDLQARFESASMATSSDGEGGEMSPQVRRLLQRSEARAKLQEQQIASLMMELEHQKQLVKAVESVSGAKNEQDARRRAGSAKISKEGARGRFDSGRSAGSDDSDLESDVQDEEDERETSHSSRGSSKNGSALLKTATGKKEKGKAVPVLADQHREWCATATKRPTHVRSMNMLRADAENKLIPYEGGGLRMCLADGRVIRGWFGAIKVAGTYMRGRWYFNDITETADGAEKNLCDEADPADMVSTVFPWSWRQWQLWKDEVWKQIDRRGEHGFKSTNSEDRKHLRKFLENCETKIQTIMSDVSTAEIDSRRHITGWAVFANFLWHVWNRAMCVHDFSLLVEDIDTVWSRLKVKVELTNHQHPQDLREAMLFLRYSCDDPKCKIGAGMSREICSSCDRGLDLLGKASGGGSSALKKEKNAAYSAWKKAQAQGAPTSIALFLAVPGNERFKFTEADKKQAWSDEAVYKKLKCRQNLIRSHAPCA